MLKGDEQKAAPGRDLLDSAGGRFGIWGLGFRVEAVGLGLGSRV